MSGAFDESPKVPLELVLTILELLSAGRDWPSLAAFSCTCRHYFRPARKLLFEKISLRLHPVSKPITTKDISSRISGLRTLFEKDPYIRDYIQRFELLDSHPVASESEWITQLPELPAFIDLLSNVRQFTFGCVLGFLDGRSLSPSLLLSLEKLLDKPHLKVFTLYNMSFPNRLLETSAQYLYVHNVHPAQRLLMDPDGAVAQSRLRYLNAHMECLSFTSAVWHIMQRHAEKLKVLKLRCWEDSRSTVDWAYVPSEIDLGQMKALRRLSLRLSFGAVARDLMQVHQILDNITGPSSLSSIDLDVSCPAQTTWFGLEDVQRHRVWCLLSEVLRRNEYSGLQRLSLVFRVWDFEVKMPDEPTSSSVVEMQRKMDSGLMDALSTLGLEFRCCVIPFLPPTTQSLEP